MKVLKQTPTLEVEKVKGVSLYISSNFFLQYILDKTIKIFYLISRHSTYSLIYFMNFEKYVTEIFPK